MIGTATGIRRPARTVAAPRAAARLAERAVPRTAAVGALGAVFLAVVAAATRLPYLASVPRLTDETAEVLLAFAISRGDRLPLTNVDPYIGPHFSYVLAGLFRLVGPEPLMPRATVAGFGILTVVCTAGLAATAARLVGPRPRGAAPILAAALLAGLMLALNPLHSVVNSRVAWSHAVTPLFTTAGLWALLVGVEGRRPRALIGAGLSLGLAVSTHPTAALLVAAAGPYVLWRGRALLRSPWLWGALAIILAVNLPILVFNVASGGGSVTGAAAVLKEYGHGQVGPAHPTAYLQSVGRHLLLLEQLVAGPLALRPPTWAAVLDPVLLAYGALALAAFGSAARRPAGLLLVLPTAALVAGMAYLNTSKHEPVTDGRYLAPALPLVAVAVGCLAARLLSGLRRRWLRSAVALGLLAAAVQPGLHLWPYVEQAGTVDPSTTGMLAEARRIADAARPGETVVLDARLGLVTIRSRGANDQALRIRALNYVLTMAGVPFVVAPLSLDVPVVRQLGSVTRPGPVVIASESTRGRTDGGLSRAGLRDLDGGAASQPRPSAGFAGYRAERRARSAAADAVRAPNTIASQAEPAASSVADRPGR